MVLDEECLRRDRDCRGLWRRRMDCARLARAINVELRYIMRI